MTSNVSYARGKRIFNSLMTTAGLVVVGVAGVTLYVSSSNSEKAAISSEATQRLSLPVISDFERFDSVPELANAPYLNKSLPLKQAAASSNASRQWKAYYRIAQISATCNGTLTNQSGK